MENEFYAEIIFRNITDTELKLENNLWSNTRWKKNIVSNENGKLLFTFKFDKLCGGAEIINYKNNSGLKIKGRWFKLWTRLFDEKDNHLVVFLNGVNGYKVKINRNDIDPLMIITTIYYYIYAKRNENY